MFRTILLIYAIIAITFFILYAIKEHISLKSLIGDASCKYFDDHRLINRIANFATAVLLIIISLFICIILSPVIYFGRNKPGDEIAQKLKEYLRTVEHISLSDSEKDEEKENKFPDLKSYQFRIRHNDLIRPDENQIYYIETSKNPQIRDFFDRNYDKVVEIFKTKYRREWCNQPLEFVYFPRIIQNLNLVELLSYNRPDISDNINISKNEIFNNIQNEFINGICGNITEITYQAGKAPVVHFAEGFCATQGFVHYRKTAFNAETNKSEDIYSFAQLYYENDEQFLDLIEYYVSQTGNHEAVRFHRKKWWQDVPPEYDEEVQQIAKEIQERVKRLQCIGLNNIIINKLVLPEVTLSKLRITKDYKLFLTDYKNTEIVMPTLSKTLYFFYLRHPEGVPFKLLDDHKEELFQIYKRVTNRDDIDALRKSIDYLVDPQYNSINEKASRIKTAFVNAFDDNIARNYYISLQDTDVALNRRITLDRNLVIDEAGIVKK